MAATGIAFKGPPALRAPVRAPKTDPKAPGSIVAGRLVEPFPLTHRSINFRLACPPNEAIFFARTPVRRPRSSDDGLNSPARPTRDCSGNREVPVKQTTESPRGNKRRGPNLYEILRVNPRARPEQIRNAFRRVALRCHPDRNPSPEATARFLQALRAFKILSDPTKRAAYDRGLAGGKRIKPREIALAEARATQVKAPPKVARGLLNVLAISLAVSLPLFIGAAEAFGYRRWVYGLAVLFAAVLVWVFRLR